MMKGFSSKTLPAFIAGVGFGAAMLASAWFFSGDDITTQTIQEAEKLMAVEFSEDQREQMMSSLVSRAAGIHQLREIDLDNSVPMALYFNPVPPGKTIPNPDQIEIDWKIPSGVELPENADDLAFYTVSDLASLLQSGKISSVELTRFYLDRLEKFDPELEAVISLTPEIALKQAEKMDRERAAGTVRGPLHGIPYGLKDLFAVEGTKTTWGATPFKDQEIDQTATVVQKLEDAGAVLVAKLTLGALAYGDIWYGGRTNSPWNTELGSSGSSAGSAAATAAGLVPFAIGTETLGSIVSPSTRNGTTGLRPTFGRVSRTGAMALSWSMDKVGPITRSVHDAAMVFDAIRGSDGLDLAVKDFSFNYEKPGGEHPLENVRIGFLESAFEAEYPNAEQDRQVLEDLRKSGAELIPVELPEFPTAQLFDILIGEAAAAFDELTVSGSDSLLVWQEDAAWPNTFRAGRFISAVDWINMNRHRTSLMLAMDEMMEEIDAFVSPSFAPGNLIITNLTGHPAVVMPNGFDEMGMPVSITFTGHLFDEARLLYIAESWQHMTDHHRTFPPGF